VEAATGTFTVALDGAPASPVTVTVARSAGDGDVTVTGGATLTFNATNFGVPQTVTISAAKDADNTNDTATLSVTAPSLSSRSVTVNVTDIDSAAPVITTTPKLTAVVGAPYTYDVDAIGTPVPTFSLTAMPTGMTIVTATGVIGWTPTAVGSFGVTVRAANGVSPDATQPYTIVVDTDKAPTCVLTKPATGDSVSGTNAEFFGDGVDDVAVARAEFLVDGVLKYTDPGPAGHYHYNGEHNRFDTTAFTNGAHVARMTVVDSTGKSCFAEASITINNAGDGGVVDASGDGSLEVAVDSTAHDGFADAPKIDASDATGADAARPDTGTGGSDTGLDPDAGEEPGADASSSCGCRVIGERDGGELPHLLAGLAIAAVSVVVRRRRRERSAVTKP
ncbi:MAG: Ig domain-containing protein, partial [Polyangiales bacterium]